MTDEKDTFEILLDLSNKGTESYARELLISADYSPVSPNQIVKGIVPEIIVCDPKTVLNYISLIEEKHNIVQLVIIRATGDEQFEIDQKTSTLLADAWTIHGNLEREDFLNFIAKACIMLELERENLLLKSLHRTNFSDTFLKANSKSMKEILLLVQKIAGLEGTILITGESGTGKTMIARYIHNLSTHHDGSFISVSCATLPRDLVESELFGHEKGAFTGAAFQRAGAAELADNGTLFLDEIGELPIELQPKLLTFLQDKMVRRVGGASEKKVNTRIIAATNSSLEEMISHKQFREDLYYRLNVFHIRMPALRERIEDLPLLTQAILSRISKERGSKELSIDKKTLERLKNYSWPGNIRELENRLERASAFSNGNIVDSKILFESINIKSPSPKIYPVSEVKTSGTLDSIEKDVIEKRLIQFEGDKKAAAKSLGISLKTLYNKISKYEIPEVG